MITIPGGIEPPSRNNACDTCLNRLPLHHRTHCIPYKLTETSGIDHDTWTTAYSPSLSNLSLMEKFSTPDAAGISIKRYR